MPADDLDRFCDKNPGCPLHGQRGADNLFGRRPRRQGEPPVAGLQRLQGPLLRVQGDPAVQVQAPSREVLSIPEHLADGCDIRQTARLVGVTKDAVTRPALLAGRHAKADDDEFVGFSPPRASKSSSMRSGPSSGRSRATATPATRPTITVGTTGITAPTTRTTDSCWR